MCKLVDISSLLSELEIFEDFVRIKESPGMYPHKPVLSENWAYYSGHSFIYLREKLAAENRLPASIALVGIGSGVEGIIAGKVFHESLKQLIITDVDQEIVAGAVDNIRCAIPEHIEVIPLVGLYCEPLVPAGLTADLVYGNIPDLPAIGRALSRWPERGAFIPSALFENYNPDPKFIKWALGSQFAFLKSAKEVIGVGGSVITALGGRVPWVLIEELFGHSGLKLEEVVTGFKKQDEAIINFQGYYCLEKEFGVEFEFYPLEGMDQLFREQERHNPTDAISGAQIKYLLRGQNISANDALGSFGNLPIGHTVHILRGIKQK